MGKNNFDFKKGDLVYVKFSLLTYSTYSKWAEYKKLERWIYGRSLRERTNKNEIFKIVCFGYHSDPYNDENISEKLYGIESTVDKSQFIIEEGGIELIPSNQLEFEFGALV